MTGVVDQEGGRSVRVVVGVDTHQDKHVAVAIDRQGVRLGELHAPATMHGYQDLERWSRSLGEIHAFGIEGTGSYGAGVARYLTRRGHTVVEVNRPDRSTRYRKGKSDPTDAEMAARSVLAGVAEATPKSGEGEVEMIRMLKSAKDSAVKARTQAFNQMKALIVRRQNKWDKRGAFKACNLDANRLRQFSDLPTSVRLDSFASPPVSSPVWRLGVRGTYPPA